MEQDDKFQFAEPRNRPRRDLFGHAGGVPVICFCCVISAARWMRPPANRTMKCCGGGNRDSGLPPRRERAESEVTSIQAYKLLTIKLLYSMFLINYYIGAFA